MITVKALLFSPLLLAIASTVQACEAVTLGDLTVKNAWSRATVGIKRPGVFYAEITNAGATDDALVGIETPVANMAMLHQTVVSDGVASMSHVMAIPVAAGQTAKLEPGGHHGMLMGLNTALNEGDTVTIKLAFENAGDVTLDVEVLSLRSEGPGCGPAAPTK